MSASLHRFRSRRAKLRAEQAGELRQMVMDFGDQLGLPESVVGRVVAAVDRETFSEGRWPFMLLGIRENAAVVDWLTRNSARPGQAVRLWAHLLTAVRYDTGEIVLTRAEMAELVGCPLVSVSRVLTELVELGAISRKREGRVYRYFLNPWCGTRLGGKARDEAQAEAAQLRLMD